MHDDTYTLDAFDIVGLVSKQLFPFLLSRIDFKSCPKDQFDYSRI